MKINIDEQLAHAVSCLEKGTEQDLNNALNIFNAILNLDHHSAVLLFYIGTVFLRKKFNALAIHIFKLAISIDPDLHCVWNNLGYVYREERKMLEAREAFLKATEINPDDSDAWMNLGAVYVANGEPEKTIEYCDKALAINPDNVRATWNKSLALLEQGNYAEGWKLYDAGFRTDDRNERYYKNVPKWDGTPGKTVVVYGEQGIGDEIMFASILDDLAKDCCVIFDAHPRLYKLFRQSFPYLTVYGTRKDKALAWPAFHDIDAKIPIGSLGKYYRKTSDAFHPGLAYLTADETLIKKYRDKLNALGIDKPKIGISWKGGTKQTNVKERFITLDKWLPIFEAIDADFISLQYTDDAPEHIKKLEDEHSFIVHHWQEAIDDYDETAALVTNLDFIISVPQSVVHLAGALGTPTLQLNPKQALWQMGVYGQDMPWYASVKNIWQETSGDWQPVIEKAAEELCKLYQMSIAS